MHFAFMPGRARTRALLLVSLAIAVAAGCTLVVDGRIDENAGVDCGEAADGTSCGSFAISVDGLCTGSRCGDALVDTASGEECEDGNEDVGDGCEPGTCTFTCNEDLDCVPTDNPCAGGGTCNLNTHLCEPGGLPPDGTVECSLPGDVAGLCRKGDCAPPGCGDGVVGAGEECDDDTAGCAGNCQWVCESDGECSDGNVCTGTETCDIASHTCSEGAGLDCDDADPCSIDSCDPLAGCQHVQADGDGDHFAPATCAEGSAFQGGDCDDADIAQYPGAPEVCHNGEDDDCDGMIDELESPITWYPDADGDGYPASTGAVQDCQDPNDTDPTNPIAYIQPPLSPQGQALFDCADTMPSVNPAQSFRTGFHCRNAGGARVDAVCSSGGNCGAFPCICLWTCPDTHPTRTYDWNCDGSNERRWDTLYASCCGTNGWTDGSVPGCGAAPEPLQTRNCLYFTCCGSVIGGVTGDGVDAKASCTSTVADTAQQCR